MAEKKYLDITGLGQYDAKIKALINEKDAATLASAKEYANGLAGNYDAEGSAAQALVDAKAYTDEKIGEVNTVVAGVKTTAEQGVANAATAQAAADKAQGEVDSLETLVGTLPTGITATTVVGYIDEKTANIASDATVNALADRVTQAEKDIDAIEADYLKSADKTELSGLITAEQNARIAADEALDERLVEVEAFFKLAEGESLDTALDTLVEIQNYLDGEGAAADQMVLDIAANKDAIEAEVERATGAEEALDGRLDTAEAEIDALQAAIGESGSVAQDISEAVAAEAKLRQEADNALDAKISANATAAKNAQDAADQAQEEVDALETVVAGKVAQGDHDALAGRVTTAEGKITTLEGASHTHTNKTVLDGITAALVADWNDAVAKEHEHSNKTVLDGITSQLVANWNAAEANACAYTDEKIAEFKAITTSEVDALFQ